ncbi:uncharacterized protein F5147DRAFT_547370, partial [Suillus discolor]
KPKTIGQWRNTDLLSMMLEDSAWHRSFIPTVFLWAGVQPKFWTIETEQLLPALQSIFDVAYPGTNHNVQPKGPIIGLQVLATNLLEDYAFLYEDPETCDPDQIYWSIFMLEMIEAAHINAIAGFLDVPALNTHGLHLMGMQAVIAACTAALERAFSFAAKPKTSADDQSTTAGSTNGSSKPRKMPLKRNKSSGKDSTAASAFSEANCGLVMSEYYDSLQRRRSKYTMDII